VIRGIGTFVRLAMLVALVLPAPLWSQEIPYWPADQEKRLKELGDELLEVQRERFQAIFFSKDEEAVKRLDERFSSIQKERRALIKALDGN
jgi:uncharacterized membrane protein (DUF106 family)